MLRVSDLQTILAELRRLQPELAARYPIRRMGVFGSYARGEQRETSDLDLLVDLGPGPTLIDLASLERELGERLGVRIDLALTDALKPRLAPRVLAEVVMV